MKAVLNSLAVIVGIPTLLASIYFGFFATEVYVSESRFAIRSAKADGGSGGLAALLSSPIVATASQESLVVLDYVHSHDMLDQIRESIDVRAHYSNSDIDQLSRMPANATREESLDYFRQKVELVRDSESDVVMLKARAFDAGTAQQLARLVIKLSEELVNELSTRMEEDALITARAEVALAVEKVRDASDALTRFRKVNSSLNPAQESSALLGIVSGIETSLVTARAELGEKLAFMQDSSPAVVALKNRINALSRQLRLERGRLVGTGEGQEMSDLIEGYQPLVLEQELAKQQYASALTSLELARIEAQRKKQYLVTFISPNLPDEAVEPRRLLKVLSVAVFSFFAYLIGGLLWSALKDHIGR